MRQKNSGKNLFHLEEMRALAMENRNHDAGDVSKIHLKLDQLLAAFQQQQEDINMIKKALSIQTTQPRRQSVLQPQIIGIIEEETSSVDDSSQALKTEGSVSFDNSSTATPKGQKKMLIEEEAPP